MKIGQTIQCRACGASSLIKHENNLMLECEYCGAMMTFKEDSQTSFAIKPQHKPLKLGILLVIIPVLVIILMIVFWFVFQNIRKHTTMESYVPENTEVNETLVETTKNPTVQSKQQTVTNNKESLNELLTIQSQVSGVTSNGGKYWVLGVKNNSNQRMARPGVMLSLFNHDGQRIEEQGGWSLREVLEPQEQTVVLLFLGDVPAETAEQKINTFASHPSQLGLKQVDITVADYSVSNKNNSFEIIGDVVNKQDFSVKYVRLMAVAYDVQGQPIGIGNAFSTDKDLAPNQRSGFKVKVGTFLQGEPVTWGVWALGRQ